MDILPRKQITSRNSRPPRAIAPLAAQPRPARAGLSSKPRRSLRRRLLAYGLVFTNCLFIAAVGYMVLVYSDGTSTSYGVGQGGAQAKLANPLDSLSAADIAANVASMTGLPETLAVTNQAETIDLYLNEPPLEKEYVNKSQILSAQIKTKADIKEHVVADGEKLADLATKYGVTSDSIRWSNNLTGDSLRSGVTLLVPPVNGFIYTVGVGDTADKLAQTYSANAQEIVAFNDAEIKGFSPGEKIMIPGGVKQETRRAILSFKANYGYNGYWYGYCTWYVATKISVPNNWRNARDWDNFARLTPGWVVSSVPVPGAIAQTNAGPEGHVAVVEAVSEDGNMIKYSDMNGIAGWGRAGYSDWVPTHSRFQNFIYRAL